MILLYFSSQQDPASTLLCEEEGFKTCSGSREMWIKTRCNGRFCKAFFQSFLLLRLSEVQEEESCSHWQEMQSVWFHQNAKEVELEDKSDLAEHLLECIPDLIVNSWSDCGFLIWLCGGPHLSILIPSFHLQILKYKIQPYLAFQAWLQLETLNDCFYRRY